VELEKVQQAGDAMFEKVGRDVAQSSDKSQILARGEMRIEIRLLGHVTHAPLVLNRVVVERQPIERDVPALGSRSPTTRFTVVLLPEPLGPRYPTISARMNLEW
jgi:hypothetical protein